MSIAKLPAKRIALFCLTPGGKALAEKIRPLLQVHCYTSSKLVSEGFEPFHNGFAATLQQAFASHDALIVIGATGITVRVLAPVIQDKMSDPAVIVLDEKGEFVISLLSGHLGGANELAVWLADRMGGQAVITTATDVNQLTSFDLLARDMDATFNNFRSTVKTLNQMLVSGERIGIWWHPDMAAEQDNYALSGLIPVTDLQSLPALDALVCVSYHCEEVLLPVPVYKLIPRRIVAGMGCRKDADADTALRLFAEQLTENNLLPQAVCAIGSITLKAQEPALLAVAAHYQVPFTLFSTEELAPIAVQFPASEFVKKTIGIGSVSRPVAWLMSKGCLIGQTCKTQGITITLGAKRVC
ncbi:cobalt-precorrin 5A hydrolase [Klebsiella sp. BIGb0407]|uniref:cobalt-precorrin 5A hydrolase n=1 Tax=Klebsiella sp. BIGb0407 TaxID=2940603 RepID=UPI0021688F6A|nr:cobalt-precorrin 5A hydrolase [Klebsiella sp. BIGb0407]MCS3433976.1 cobalt-precorrin 5A hydrolase [Klebsiella sp. BIGb0407]